jgi:hypothetical protein
MTETIIPIPALLEDLSSNKSRNRKLWGTGTHFSGNGRQLNRSMQHLSIDRRYARRKSKTRTDGSRNGRNA